MINFPIDFPITEPSIMSSGYCLLMYLICLLYSHRLSNAWNIVTIKKIPSSSIIFFVSFVGFFFITNCMNGDFFHTMGKVHAFQNTDLYFFNGEPIYREITKFVNNNYLLFRSIVWGGAFVFFCITTRRMRIPLFLAVSTLCISYSIIFCYARVTAAMAVYFFGISFFCSPYKYKLVGYIIGLSLIYFSWQFHTSALIMILMTFVIFLPVKKWSIVAVVLVTPIIASYLKDYFFLFAMDEDTDEFMSNKLLNYSEREVVTGFVRQITNLLTYASIYVPLYFCYKLIFSKNEILKKDHSVIFLFKVSFGLAYAATTFLFFGETFYTFFYRILNMTMIPISLLLSKLYADRKLSNRLFLYCIIIGMVSQLVQYSYMIYLNR